MKRGDLLVRNVSIGGEHGVNVLIRSGRIAAMGVEIHSPEQILDGDGCALIPGLHDHHIHLLATAAQARTVDVGPEATLDANAFALRLQGATPDMSGWIRAAGYHESIAGELDRTVLDGIDATRPIRVQHRSGGLWVLNSVALRAIMSKEDRLPSSVETDDAGQPTGRIWRGDDWLLTRMPRVEPDLASLGARLARVGVTGVTDASVTTGEEQALLFESAAISGLLPQNLTLMSGGFLPESKSHAYRVGPVKVVLDDPNLGDFGAIHATIENARNWQRTVAIHCVTADQLAFALAAFESAGTRDGDRIEHGAIVDDAAADQIARLGLRVVTQPGFIAERGDHYMREVGPEDILHLYRCRGLLRRGIRVAGSTDAPYTSFDPWRAIKAATNRMTRRGAVIAPEERLIADEALAMFLTAPADPGGEMRRLVPGARADLCLLDRSYEAALASPSSENVLATICAGQVVYDARSFAGASH